MSRPRFKIKSNPVGGWAAFRWVRAGWAWKPPSRYARSKPPDPDKQRIKKLLADRGFK